MLSLVKLRDAEYVLSQIAGGLDEYYTSGREAPGVWAGSWSEQLGLSGIVEADQLRALVKGRDARTGTSLLEGRPRTVNAFDGTFSAPKSASLLWAFGGPEVESAVSLAHVEAVSTALAFLESHVAVARQQQNGIRTRVPTEGLAAATFVHRTSRAGDPQLHTHCVIPNLARRCDGSHVALDAAPLYEWARAAGCVYQEELRRRLTATLGVAWGPDRNGTREMAGFDGSQLRAFSKRTAQIEAWLEVHGSSAPQSPAERMAADEAASLATRIGKHQAIPPEVLAARWAQEADAVGLGRPEEILRRVCGRGGVQPAPSAEVVFAHLTDPEAGLCSRTARFGRAQVAAAIASLGGGTLDAARVEELSVEFIASPHVVRLAPDPATARRRPPQFSLVNHRALEDRVLAHLATLRDRLDPGLCLHPGAIGALIERGLGPDQSGAVAALCATGPALRALLSPPGHGKTTTLAVAAGLAGNSGRDVVGLATTNQAVAELRRVGIPARTIAHLRAEGSTLAVGSVVILDEISQVSTADAEALASAVVTTPGASLWCAGDAAQAQSVRAGGLADEIERLARQDAIPAPALTHNRRQLDEAERAALSAYRAGYVGTSQERRSAAGLEHEFESPLATKAAMADAVVGDVHSRGADAVAALCATHADAEELADRIRAQLAEAGRIGGPVMWGPGWTTARAYAPGDRVLLHAPHGADPDRLHNHTTATVMGVNNHGLAIHTDDGRARVLDQSFVTGARTDGQPNLSHAWARTVDGAQGGTWEQVHLLGNAALDHQTGYVGQSRGRHPTHTWNARRVAETDHGGRRVQAPSAADEVRSALEREDRQVFAATEDPTVLDRQLRAERARHREVLARRPPHVDIEVRRARAAVKKEAENYRWALARQDKAQRSLGQASRVRHRFTRAGRDGRHWAEHEERVARQVVPHARDRMDEANAQVRRLEKAIQAGEAFDRQEGWRHDRLAGIDDGLEHHWAEAVLSAVREGDPLAYGPDRLRQARSTYAADMAGIERDDERHQSGPGGRRADRSRAGEQRIGASGKGELSAVVAELEEAIEQFAPSPLEQSSAVRATHDRSRTLAGLDRRADHLDYSHDLGLGR